MKWLKMSWRYDAGLSTLPIPALLRDTSTAAWWTYECLWKTLTVKLEGKSVGRELGTLGEGNRKSQHLLNCVIKQNKLFAWYNNKYTYKRTLIISDCHYHQFKLTGQGTNYLNVLFIPSGKNWLKENIQNVKVFKQQWKNMYDAELESAASTYVPLILESSILRAARSSRLRIMSV